VRGGLWECSTINAHEKRLKWFTCEANGQHCTLLWWSWIQCPCPHWKGPMLSGFSSSKLVRKCMLRKKWLDPGHSQDGLLMVCQSWGRREVQKFHFELDGPKRHIREPLFPKITSIWKEGRNMGQI
jgi:hypothetical protein